MLCGCRVKVMTGVRTVRVATSDVIGELVAAGWLMMTLYWSPLSFAVTVAGVVYELVVSPVSGVHVVPLSSDFSHWYVTTDASDALAVTVKVAASGWYLVWSCGWETIASVGLALTVRVAASDVISPAEPTRLTITLYWFPLAEVAALEIVYELLTAPEIVDQLAPESVDSSHW